MTGSTVRSGALPAVASAATTVVVIGSVARSGATGRGISRSFAVCVSFPTVGRQQSGIADPIAACDDSDDDSMAGQQGLFGTQQKDAIGTAATRRTVAIARAHAIRDFAFRVRPATDDMLEE